MIILGQKRLHQIDLCVDLIAIQLHIPLCGGSCQALLKIMDEQLIIPYMPDHFLAKHCHIGFGQDDPLYFTKSGILNLWGITTSRTKLGSMASIPLIELLPSMAS